MIENEIRARLEKAVENLDQDNFIFEFLFAYGVSASIITRLKKGDQNRSKRKNELLYSKKIIFRLEDSNNLLNAIDEIKNDPLIQKYSPRFAIMTDYSQLVAKDLDLGKSLDIRFRDLPRHYDFFLPLVKSEVYQSTNDNEADRNAAETMGELYDHLIKTNPAIYQSKTEIHNLNVFLSRLLFCFFAEDTGIFPEDSIFTKTLVEHTDESGSDTHLFLDNLFSRLDSKETEDLPEYLVRFPYVNGGLFGQGIASPKFSATSRKILIKLGSLQWKNVNPDIFGSMIQAVTTGDERSKLGQHYTSVSNIKDLIKPLFLDEFYAELEKATTVKQLYKLQNRLANTKFFDPACGSGNFLTITYKELRVLEIKIIEKIIEMSGDDLENNFASQILISQFYGIEIDDFAHEIAILSLWLAEHQMNIIFQESLFGFAMISSILPLKTIGNIQLGNAVCLDWEQVCPSNSLDEVYIIGNPPYWGSAKMSDIQKNDMATIIPKYGKLDYVACWFVLAQRYIQDRKSAKCAFVATNSICQGEQVHLLWPHVLNNKVEIDFAYTSFPWKNHAKANAKVFVVIVALRPVSNKPKYILNHGRITESYGRKTKAKNISPYLRDEKTVIVSPLSKSNKLLAYPSPTRVTYIDKSADLFFDEDQKNANINDKNAKFIRQLIGADELIQGINRYCIYVDDSDLMAAREDSFIRERIDACATTRKDSSLAHRFCKKNIDSKKEYLVIPRVSSGSREYLPINVFMGGYAYNDSVQIIENPTHVILAILLSRMHLLWASAVCGQLKADFRYSTNLCFNTFPFPQTDSRKDELLRQYVNDILATRAKHVGKTLAWMYSPETMPADLRDAHHALDEAVESFYKLSPFKSDKERLDHMFKLYEKLTSERERKKRG